MIQSGSDTANVNQIRYQRKPYTAKSGFRGGKFRRNGSNGRFDFFCPGCFTVGKELKVAIDFKHKPDMCPRIHAVPRYMQVDTFSETEGESNEDKEDAEIHDGNLNDNLPEQKEKYSL